MLDVNTTKIRCSGDVTDKTHGQFICGPLDRGYGTTIGNSLKRILLSSIQGAAVTAVKIAGATAMDSKLSGYHLPVIYSYRKTDKVERKRSEDRIG